MINKDRNPQNSTQIQWVKYAYIECPWLYEILRKFEPYSKYYLAQTGTQSWNKSVSVCRWYWIMNKWYQRSLAIKK